jgi:DNA (cytosine-5)-methyltransferase 1
MDTPIGIVDLFSGPGGLGEGFSRVRTSLGGPAFEIDLSVEKDPVAHATLRLRSFLRKFGDAHPPEYIEFLNADRSEEPDWASLYPEKWDAACHETLNLALGEDSTRPVLSRRLSEIKKLRGERIVLIGGPPCQAYSLAGRGRKPKHKGYVPHPEERHLLYREYISILRDLRPAAFVMENVKGMLSSRIGSESVFGLVVRDLRTGGGAAEYDLFPLDDVGGKGAKEAPSSFLVHSERHGVPQARHRVIIMGIRRDLCTRVGTHLFPGLSTDGASAIVRDAIGAMPPLRSRLSPRQQDKDSPDEWARIVRDHAIRLTKTYFASEDGVREEFERILRTVRPDDGMIHCGSAGGTRLPPSCPERLRRWIEDPRLRRLTSHETRAHMRDDLERYLFASCWAMVMGRFPKAHDFPERLAPKHANWTSGQYKDRFRVQVWDAPSSTVTCHVSKDGHSTIHPDPHQCRTLTVREVARLQTFPDNYFFKGNRTQQYVQVGNAVPPFLALQIGEALLPALEAALAIGEGVLAERVA